MFNRLLVVHELGLKHLFLWSDGFNLFPEVSDFLFWLCRQFDVVLAGQEALRLDKLPLGLLLLQMKGQRLNLGLKSKNLLLRFLWLFEPLGESVVDRRRFMSMGVSQRNVILDEDWLVLESFPFEGSQPLDGLFGFGQSWHSELQLVLSLTEKVFGWWQFAAELELLLAWGSQRLFKVDDFRFQLGVLLLELIDLAVERLSFPNRRLLEFCYSLFVFFNERQSLLMMGVDDVLLFFGESKYLGVERHLLQLMLL